jgi:hypothetical protein
LRQNSYLGLDQAAEEALAGSREVASGGHLLNDCSGARVVSELSAEETMQETTIAKSYEQLVAEVKRLQKEGTLPREPTREQRISWAYGQTKLENDDVTLEDAIRAVDSKRGASHAK